MDLEIVNPHVMKIIIAAREVDSINSIAKRIKLSYGWTHKWINELIDIGVFKATRMQLYLQKNNGFYNRVLSFVNQNFKNDINFHYNVISLFGIPYCFTKTDSVFVWTKGGYNIARYKGHYPIFIKIRKSDYDLFQFYSNKLRLNQSEIYYEIQLVETIECEFVENIPVDSLQKTIQYMKKYIYNFQPALEMVEKMYNIKIGVKYQEAKNV